MSQPSAMPPLLALAMQRLHLKCMPSSTEATSKRSTVYVGEISCPGSPLDNFSRENRPEVGGDLWFLK